jgi:hypothetical protein
MLPQSTYLALKRAAEQKRKTETELAVEAIQAYLDRLTHIDPLLGLFADDPALIDSIASDAMRERESTPLRVAR